MLIYFARIDVKTKIIEVNLAAFVYRLFHEDFSPLVGTFSELFMKQSVNKCI